MMNEKLKQKSGEHLKMEIVFPHVKYIYKYIAYSYPIRLKKVNNQRKNEKIAFLQKLEFCLTTVFSVLELTVLSSGPFPSCLPF